MDDVKVDDKVDDVKVVDKVDDVKVVDKVDDVKVVDKVIDKVDDVKVVVDKIIDNVDDIKIPTDFDDVKIDDGFKEVKKKPTKKSVVSYSKIKDKLDNIVIPNGSPKKHHYNFSFDGATYDEDKFKTSMSLLALFDLDPSVTEEKDSYSHKQYKYLVITDDQNNEVKRMKVPLTAYDIASKRDGWVEVTQEDFMYECCNLVDREKIIKVIGSKKFIHICKINSKSGLFHCITDKFEWEHYYLNKFDDDHYFTRYDKNQLFAFANKAYSKTRKFLNKQK